MQTSFFTWLTRLIVNNAPLTKNDLTHCTDLYRVVMFEETNQTTPHCSVTLQPRGYCQTSMSYCLKQKTEHSVLYPSCFVCLYVWNGVQQKTECKTSAQLSFSKPALPRVRSSYCGSMIHPFIFRKLWTGT